MKKIIAVIAVLFVFAQCDTKKGIPETFDYGTIANGTYTNKFFDFEIAVPAGWHNSSKEEMDQLNEQGRELITGGDEQKKSEFKAAEVNTASLFQISKFSLETVDTANFNMSVISMAEKIDTAQKIETASDYLVQVKQHLSNAQLPISIDEGTTTVMLGGKDFLALSTHYLIPGTPVDQVYYTTLLNGFALSFICTTQGDEQKTQMQEILSKLKFN